MNAMWIITSYGYRVIDVLRESEGDWKFDDIEGAKEVAKSLAEATGRPFSVWSYHNYNDGGNDLDDCLKVYFPKKAKGVLDSETAYTIHSLFNHTPDDDEERRNYIRDIEEWAEDEAFFKREGEDQ